MRVLLIEDEQNVASFIRKGLEENGLLVSQAFDGEMGLKMANQDEYDLIIMDVVMPLMNGFEVCTKLREEYHVETPILLLTALGTTDDVVEGLNGGADDYLTKPFKLRELLARINALTRRNKRQSPVLRVEDLELHTESKEVFRAGKPIPLTAREFRLLECLLRNKNKVMSRTELLERVWDINYDLGTNVVEVYINYLRKKIDNAFPVPLIKTVVGMGYTIKERAGED